MKVWFVVTIMHHVVMSQGPLPYSKAECDRRIPVYASVLEGTAIRHGAAEITMNYNVPPASFKFPISSMQCLLADARPR